MQSPFSGQHQEIPDDPEKFWTVGNPTAYAHVPFHYFFQPTREQLNNTSYLGLNMVPELERIVFLRFESVFQYVLCLFVVDIVNVVCSH